MAAMCSTPDGKTCEIVTEVRFLVAEACDCFRSAGARTLTSLNGIALAAARVADLQPGIYDTIGQSNFYR